MNKRLVFIKSCYVFGILTMLANAVIYLFPSFTAAKILSDADITPAFRYVFVHSALFMLAWAVLFAWALGSPLKRRGVLLLTVFPVCLGMAAYAAYVLLTGEFEINTALLMFIIPFLIGILFLKAYFSAGRLEKELGFLMSGNLK